MMTAANISFIRALIKIGAGYFVAKGMMDQDQAETLAAAAVALFSVIWGMWHRTPPLPTDPPEPPAPGKPPFLMALAFLLALSGCSTLDSTTTHTTIDPATGLPVTANTRAKVKTFFDGNSALTKFRNSPAPVTGTNGFVWSAGTSIGTLNESSQAPSLGEIIGQALKAYTGK